MESRGKALKIELISARELSDFLPSESQQVVIVHVGASDYAPYSLKARRYRENSVEMSCRTEPYSTRRRQPMDAKFNTHLGGNKNHEIIALKRNQGLQKPSCKTVVRLGYSRRLENALMKKFSKKLRIAVLFGGVPQSMMCRFFLQPMS